MMRLCSGQFLACATVLLVAGVPMFAQAGAKPPPIPPPAKSAAPDRLGNGIHDAYPHQPDDHLGRVRLQGD